jgi:DNA-binding CsgD family transcriptional regulator
MRVGHRERALALAQEELALARECDHPRAIGTALRTLGLVRDGESEAIDVLREAVECHRVSGSGLELARSLTELGAALRRSRSRKESRAPLREAMDVARRCGALVAAKRAETELRASGARPRKLTFSGREGLTPSESRIASLAASGLTNREIAEQLYISRKTVEHHLSSAYRKLDIDSREKLDAALKRGSR